MSKLDHSQEIEGRKLLHTYQRRPLLFVGGEGVYLRAESGEEYLDLLSGIGVSALGYGHPNITHVLQDQGARLIHTSNMFYHEGTADLAERLTEISGMDRVFLCNSGTEAWEAALKLALAHSRQLRKEGQKIGSRILSMEHAFHGRTIGSLATTHKAAYRKPFETVRSNVDFVRFNDTDDLRAKFSSDVCAICIEPIQGEGGIHPITPEFFAAARALCDSTGALLIADEIQCGFGRTGKWFAYQNYGIQPDVTTIAKPMAGGLPMGAMLCSEEAARAITPGMHGTTFGGNPLACAMALTVIETIDQENLLEKVSDVGAYFKQQLQNLAGQHKGIIDVRGMGLMLGVEMASADLAKDVTQQMMDNHIIVNRTSDTVLRFLPPYILEKDHVDRAVATLGYVLTKIENKIDFSRVIDATSASVPPIMLGI